MNSELFKALVELEKERGIAKDILLDAIETAIISAYKKNYGASSAANVRVELNEQTGEIHVYSRKVVVDEVMTPPQRWLLMKPGAGSQLRGWGHRGAGGHPERLWAHCRAKRQTGGHSKDREAERSIIYNEYANREGDVVTGIIQRYEYRNVIVDLGNVEAVLPVSEQIRRKIIPSIRE